MAAPKGLKTTSSPIQISAFVTETALNTFAFEQIDLTLNVLDNEVFVVTQINLDVDAPDMTLFPRCSVNASVSTTQRTFVGSIAQTNNLASAQRIIIRDGGIPGEVVSFDREDPLFAAINEDYLGIIATNNAFLNLQSDNCTAIKSARVRIYGYRASASSSVYAALVQSELLSQ